MSAAARMRIGGAMIALFLAVGSTWGQVHSVIRDDWCAPVGDPQYHDGPIGYESTFGYVYGDLVVGNFKELEKKVKAWKRPDCVLRDGRPIMISLLRGYELAFKQESDWNVSASRVERLKKAYPRTDFAAIAEAQYWMSYAWNARGSGYANTVTEQGWKLFRERLEKAESILIESKPYAMELPAWYVLMMSVQKYLGRPAKEIDKVFLEGTGKFPNHLKLYTTMALYMLPKWGGNWEMYENLVKWSVNHTKGAGGTSMYARLYMYADGELSPGETVFKTTKATWPAMRRGFEDLMQRTPMSIWNLNNYAAFACQANDRKTYLAVRKRFGDKVVPQAWLTIGIDLCDHKHGYVE